jgi:uncharacterized protein involved in outer membrane biogenesis
MKRPRNLATGAAVAVLLGIFIAATYAVCMVASFFDWMREVRRERRKNRAL